MRANKGRPQGGKGITKILTLHQLHEANQLKKGGKPDKTPSLEEPSLAVIASLKMEVDCVLYRIMDAFLL
jgi:hypothetical protein